MVTVILSDTEGWNITKQFSYVDEAEQWLLDEHEINVKEDWDHDWYNPSPMLIVGDDHQIIKYESRGFRY